MIAKGCGTTHDIEKNSSCKVGTLLQLKEIPIWHYNDLYNSYKY